MSEPSTDLPSVLDEVTAALESLTAALDDENDVRVLLQGTCEQVVRAVPGVNEATVTLLRDGRPTTSASTSDLVVALDQDQYESGDGPCVRAARTGELVRVAVAQAHEQWPKFAADAEAAGMGSFLSAPIVLGDGHAGAVNCYGKNGDGFAELDQRLLELFTTAAQAALRSYLRYQRAQESVRQLENAMVSRAVIEQAKGVLMAVHHVTAEEAFTALVEESQRENIKLRVIADRLMRRVREHGSQSE